MWETFQYIWHSREVRLKILFVLAMFALFRVVAHIPVPGVDASQLSNLFQGNQLFGLLNIFSGGTIENFSIVALGVAPYITASIIFQLLAMVIPRLEEIQKDGEAGQKRINQYTRIAAVPLAFLQAYGLIKLLRSAGGQFGAGFSFSPFDLVVTMLMMTAGTIFLMWLGELISEKNIGNGISLVIFAGIIAGLPNALRQTAVTFDSTQMVNLVMFAVIAVITVVAVVVMTEGQRNIPIAYARRGSGMQSSLPLRVNLGGVIPIIFAISILLFPPVIAQFFLNAATPWVAAVAAGVAKLFANQLFYGTAYFVMVFGFTYFYTAVIFHPDRIAENLQKQGGFVPGIRPGKPTADYLRMMVQRINLGGATFLGLIAILPLLVQQLTGSQNLVVGGTSLLIVVSVLIDSIKQVQSQLIMREYEVY